MFFPIFLRKEFSLRDAIRTQPEYSPGIGRRENGRIFKSQQAFSAAANSNDLQHRWGFVFLARVEGRVDLPKLGTATSKAWVLRAPVRTDLRLAGRSSIAEQACQRLDLFTDVLYIARWAK